jgi:hypothetical protein
MLPNIAFQWKSCYFLSSVVHEEERTFKRTCCNCFIGVVFGEVVEDLLKQSLVQR